MSLERDGRNGWAFWLAVAASVLCIASHKAPAAEHSLAAGGNIQAVVDAAAAGDIITLGDGRYAGPIHIGKPVTIRAANAGKAIIAGGRITGVGGTLRGFIAEKMAGGYQSGAIHIAGPATIEGVTVRECEGVGVVLYSNSTLLNSRIIGNGYLGVANFPNASTMNVTVRGNYIARNNRGWVTRPSWASYTHPLMNGGSLGFQRNVDAAGKIVATGGSPRWFANPAWEAGGAKFAFMIEGLLVEGNIFEGNGGPGVWLDCYIRNAMVRGNESRGNIGISAGWEGPGGWDEINEGPNVWEGNYFHDNAGGGLVFMESKGWTARNNVFRNEGIRFRDIPGRAPGLRDGLMIGNRFYGPQAVAGIQPAPAGRNIRQSGNQGAP